MDAGSVDVGYHLDGGISEIDECRCDFTILSRGVQCFGVPEGQHCAHQLRKTLDPVSVCMWTAICTPSESGVVVTKALTYVYRGRRASRSTLAASACSDGWMGSLPTLLI